MQLSPLQSRLAASIIATCLLIAIYIFLFPSHFALAAELDLRLPIGPILDDALEIADRGVVEGAERRDALYEPEFAPFDRSIIGRAPAGVTGLANNVPQQLNLDPGVTACYVFERASMEGQAVNTGSLELRDLDEREVPRSLADGEKSEGPESALRRRQSSLPIFISANTCIQPQPNSTSAGLQAPQLTLYISTSAQNTCPGPGKDPSSQQSLTFTEGAVIYNMTSSADVYIGISAANATAGLDGGYNFQVAASNDAPFFNYNDQLNSDQLVWVDSDSSSSLLITHNLTVSTDTAVQAQFMASQPYVMFAQPENDTSIAGVRYSYCGLGNYARIAATKNGQFTQTVSTSITTWGTGGLPKQQFYFDGLNASSTYNGILAINGNSTASGSGVVNGGGTVYRATNFTTKAAGANCAFIFNLTFCDEVAYAVPSNNITFPNKADLANFYDNNAQTSYGFFQKGLAQIQCEAEPAARYSLNRTCADCEKAYKSWLCTVAIPRCEDFSNSSPYLQPRAVFSQFPDNSTLPSDATAGFPNNTAYNSSRNPLIDQTVMPGPYKEVLPCQDVCFNLVQSCPAALGFACPQAGDYGYDTSYGTLNLSVPGAVTCNYPGSAHFLSDARRVTGVGLLTAALPALLALLVM